MRVNRLTGSRAMPGHVTLRIRSRADEHGYPTMQVFAVTHDGEELEVEDVKQARWRFDEGLGPSEAVIEVYGVDADVDAGAVEVEQVVVGKRP